jgi:hypothetical protein
MASDPTDRRDGTSLSEEQEMLNYYNLERDTQQDEKLTNGIYPQNIYNTEKGNLKSGSNQNVCKYTHSLFRRHNCHYVVAQLIKHCATSRKVAGSIPDGAIGIFR